MPKMFLFPLAVMAALVAAVAIWPGGPVRTIGDEPPLPAGRVLHVGEQIELRDGSVLTFVELVEDSRCPADATCIWQGRAVAAFTLDGQAFKIVLGADSEATATVDGYVVRLDDVQPSPLASQPKDPADAEVTVTVTEAQR